MANGRPVNVGNRRPNLSAPVGFAAGGWPIAAAVAV